MNNDINAIRELYAYKRGKSSRSKSRLVDDGVALLASILVLVGVSAGFIAFSKLLPSDEFRVVEYNGLSTAFSENTGLISKTRKNLSYKINSLAVKSSPESKAIADKVEKHLEKEWQEVKAVSPKVIPDKDALKGSIKPLSLGQYSKGSYSKGSYSNGPYSKGQYSDDPYSEGLHALE